MNKEVRERITELQCVKTGYCPICKHEVYWKYETLISCTFCKTILKVGNDFRDIKIFKDEIGDTHND